MPRLCDVLAVCVCPKGAVAATVNGRRLRRREILGVPEKPLEIAAVKCYSRAARTGYDSV